MVSADAIVVGVLVWGWHPRFAYRKAEGVQWGVVDADFRIDGSSSDEGPRFVILYQIFQLTSEKARQPARLLIKCSDQVVEAEATLEHFVGVPIELKPTLSGKKGVRLAKATFAGLAAFAGIPAGASRLRRAIRNARFEELRRQEDASGFAEFGSGSGRFFRSGIPGAWREALTTRQVERILSCHGPTMKRFGYATPDGLPT